MRAQLLGLPKYIYYDVVKTGLSEWQAFGWCENWPFFFGWIFHFCLQLQQSWFHWITSVNIIRGIEGE